MKSISILGSTGSIGSQSLEVIAAFPDQFQVLALSAGNNVTLFKDQLLRFRPKLASVKHESDVSELRDFISHHCLQIEVVWGDSGLEAVATYSGTQLLVVAVAGTASLWPTYCAINAGISVGLACKEVLVSAGELIMELAKRKGVAVLPIDSEHAAIKQCLASVNEDVSTISRLVLTASGGPFWQRNRNTFSDITRQEALAHPNWTMGPKITIDSATLMNKGLEVIEAYYLFGVCVDAIEVVVHPQSIVHSFVEFTDGNMLAHLGLPDMRFPIQYALSYPDKWPCVWPKLDLVRCASLTFNAPDFQAFPLLRLAYDALRFGGTAPAILNAANEAAVQLFLTDRIGFTDIAPFVENQLEKRSRRALTTVSDIVALDRDIKESVLQL